MASPFDGPFIASQPLIEDLSGHPSQHEQTEARRAILCVRIPYQIEPTSP